MKKKRFERSARRASRKGGYQEGGGVSRRGHLDQSQTVERAPTEGEKKDIRCAGVSRFYTCITCRMKYGEIDLQEETLFLVD